MSRSVIITIKVFRPQRTVNISPHDGHMGIFKLRSDSSTSSASINTLEALPPVPYLYWSLYDEYAYIGKMDALYIRSVYTADSAL